MPTHSDKLMREFWPERCGKAKEWLAKQVKRKWDGEEINDALSICKLIDDHWTSMRSNASEPCRIPPAQRPSGRRRRIHREALASGTVA